MLNITERFFTVFKIYVKQGANIELSNGKEKVFPIDNDTIWLKKPKLFFLCIVVDNKWQTPNKGTVSKYRLVFTLLFWDLLLICFILFFRLMSKFRTLLAGMILLCCMSFSNEGEYNLTVNIEGIKENKGYVLLILFKGEDGFPGNSDKAYAYDGCEVKGNQASLTFKDLPPGTYAIAALHDANSNGKMDTNMLGIPKEDYGASNDAKSTFGPPKYKDAKFDVSGNQSITIKMRSVF